MRHSGGNMSHKKHRSGPWGQVTRGHRAEINRLLSAKPKRRASRMFKSMRELMAAVRENDNGD